jgi:hypothetical protein
MKESKQFEDFIIARIADRFSCSKFIRGLFLGAALISGALLETACASNNPQVAETASPEVNAQMTSIPTYHVEAAGGTYTANQEAINNSQSVKDQQTQLQRWLDYWVNFENRPFDPDSAEIRWKYIYDNIENPTEVMVFLEVGGQYESKLFTVPLEDNAFAYAPPVVEGNTLKINYEPLQLTSGAKGHWLSVENGIPVRKDINNQVVKKLNLKTGLWERVETAESEMVNRINFRMRL